MTTLYLVFATTLMYQQAQHSLISECGVNANLLLITFTDSSWNNDVDTGRSTGCFLIFYMGGVVEHSYNLPNPVALSSAESEYNKACLACMLTSHLGMFLNELELKTGEVNPPVPNSY